jgi:tRNA (cmo5U34)-methyltransferase
LLTSESEPDPLLYPQSEGEKARWLKRYAAFSVASGVPAVNADKAIEAIGARLSILSPEEDEALLRQAGFETVELFYAGFTFKGWVAYAPS